MAIVPTDPKVLKMRRWSMAIVALIAIVAYMVVTRSKVNFIGLTSFAVFACGALALETKLKGRATPIIAFVLMWMLMIGVLLSIDFLIYGSISKSEAIFAALVAASGLNIFRRAEPTSTSGD
jgi:hypothetical protein